AASRLAARTRARLVMTPFTHVPPPGALGTRMRQAYLSRLNVGLLDRADRLFVQTGLEGRVLSDAGLPAARQTIVGLGIDPGETGGGDRRRARASWGLAPDTIAVGHLGNKSWDKGTVDLLDAAERLWPKGRNFALVLAGPEMPSFTRRLKQAAY